MWEVLGWVAVACLSVVIVAVTVLAVASVVHEIRKLGNKSKRVI